MNTSNIPFLPGLNYHLKLKEEFDVKMPENTPSHIAENIYKECFSEHKTGTSNGDIKTIVEAAISSFKKFPWSNISYDDLPEPNVKHLYEDGDIIFNKDTKKYSGYYNNQIVSMRENLEKMKDVMETKYGITEFNVIGEDDA